MSPARMLTFYIPTYPVWEYKTAAYRKNIAQAPRMSHNSELGKLFLARKLSFLSHSDSGDYVSIYRLMEEVHRHARN